MSLSLLHRPAAFAAVLAAVAAAGIAGLTTTNPSAHPAAAAPAGPVSAPARAGGIEVLDGFVPEPASPQVAAAYFEIRNLSGQPDRLLAASSAVAGQSVPMSENGGMDMAGMDGQMMPLGPVTIAAHKSFDFTPGHNHLMLEQLKQTLAVGQQVTIHLFFAHAGMLTATLPVVPLDRILGNRAS